MGILIIPLHLSNVANKFPIMIGALIGGTVAFFRTLDFESEKEKRCPKRESRRVNRKNNVTLHDFF